MSRQAATPFPWQASTQPFFYFSPHSSPWQRWKIQQEGWGSCRKLKGSLYCRCQHQQWAGWADRAPVCVLSATERGRAGSTAGWCLQPGLHPHFSESPPDWESGLLLDVWTSYWNYEWAALVRLCCAETGLGSPEFRCSAGKLLIFPQRGLACLEIFCILSDSSLPELPHTSQDVWWYLPELMLHYVIKQVIKTEANNTRCIRWWRVMCSVVWWCVNVKTTVWYRLLVNQNI